MIRKIKNKLKRKAFNIYALIGGIALMATMSTVAVPSMQNFYMKQKVKTMVQKEEFIKDLFETYYKKDPDFKVEDKDYLDDLLEKAEDDKIITEEQAKRLKKNGMKDDDGNDIKMEFHIKKDANGVITRIIIDPKIPVGEKFAQATYKGMLDGLFVELDADTDAHSYTLQLGEDEVIARIDAINNNNKGKDYVLKKIAKDKYNMNLDDANDLNATEKAKTTVYTNDNGVAVASKWDGTEWVEDNRFLTGGTSADGTVIVDDVADVDISDHEIGDKFLVMENGAAVEYVLGANGLIKKAVQIEDLLPDDLDDFKVLLGRDTDKLYFDSAVNMSTNVTDDLWGQPISFKRLENYWESALQVNAPDFLNTNNLRFNVFLAEDKSKLPVANKGDLAFLTENNVANVANDENGVGGDNGYKGVQKKGQNQVGKLFPEAIYDGSDWVNFAPTVGDVLRSGFVDQQYFSYDVEKTLVKGVEVDKPIEWWHATDYKVFASMGNRDDLPVIADTANYKGGVHYLTKGKDGSKDSFVLSGMMSMFLYEPNKPFYSWKYYNSESVVNDASYITNSLADVEEGEEFMVTKDSGNIAQIDSQLLDLEDVGENEGNFLIVWNDNYTNLYGQIYNKDSRPVANKFQINSNSTPINGDEKADVKLLTNGSFIVVWIDKTNKVFGKIYKKDGDIDKGTFTIDKKTDLPKTPKVAALSDGRFAVTWSAGNDADAKDQNIYLNVYNASYNLIDNTQNPYVNGDIDDADNARDEYPQILANNDKTGFLLAWETHIPHADYKVTIQTARYIYENSKFKSKFAHKPSDKASKRPRIALIGGYYALTWFGTENDVKLTEGSYAIKAKLISQTVKNDISNTEVLTTYNINNKYATIKTLNNGHIVVAWQGDDEIKASIIKKNDNDNIDIIEGEILVSGEVDNSRMNLPMVSVLKNDNFVITWQDKKIEGDGDSNGQGIAASLLKQDGDIIAQRFLVNNIEKENKQQYLSNAGSKIKDLDGVFTTKYPNDLQTVIPTIGSGFIISWEGINAGGGESQTDINTRVFNSGNIKYLEWE
ncbi:MAG: hypothetical protein DRG78_02415 [Epsilonproteobacteria bacterium]|nr:MAG: hypothetical protein DRG78_02415 [Campylobacterota bacterium]